MAEDTVKLSKDFYVVPASGARKAKAFAEPTDFSTVYPKGTVMSKAQAEALGIPTGKPKAKSKPKTKEVKKGEDK